MTERREPIGIPEEPGNYVESPGVDEETSGAPIAEVVDEPEPRLGTSVRQPHHRGDFAEGLTQEHVSTEHLMGDYAEGQETRRRRLEPQDEHRGDFAEGQAETHTAPDALPGDFAEGQEDRPRR